MIQKIASGETLHIFKENGDEIKNNTNHSGMIILCSKTIAK